MQALKSIFSQFFNYIIYPFYALLTSPTWVFAVPGKVWGLAVHWRVGLFAGLLTTIVAVAVLVQRHMSPGATGDDYLWWQILGLVILIPAEVIAVAFAIHYWLMSLPSRHPDIDAAWQAGVNDLRANGIVLESRPLFLVLGLQNSADAASMMSWAGDDLVVTPPDDAKTPLIWAATNDAIYLFLRDCCQTTCLIGGRDTVGQVDRYATVEPSHGSQPFPGGTIGGQEDFSAGGFGSIGGFAIPPSPVVKAPEPKVVPTRVGSTPLAVFNTSATLDPLSDSPAFDAPAGGSVTVGSDDLPPSVPASRSPRQPAMRRQLARSVTEGMRDRIDYLGQKLRLALQPLCPITGILVAVPYTLLARGKEQAELLGDAVRADMEPLRNRLQCRPHVTVLVTSLNEQPGFRTFLNRFHAKTPQLLTARFGKGMSGTWTIPSDGALESLAHAACHQFEHWIFQMLKTTEALRESNNRDLFRLLARMRGEFGSCLSQFLCQAFECKEGNIEHGDWFPVSGCYFTGLRTDLAGDSVEDAADADGKVLRTAFLQGVFERMDQLQDDVGWTSAASTEDLVYRQMTNAAFLVTLAGAAGCAFVLFKNYWPQSPGTP